MSFCVISCFSEEKKGIKYVFLVVNMMLFLGIFRICINQMVFKGDYCLRTVAPMITNADNEFLLTPCTDIEIKDAPFSMHPDGLNPAFFIDIGILWARNKISVFSISIGSETISVGQKIIKKSEKSLKYKKFPIFR